MNIRKMAVLMVALFIICVFLDNGRVYATNTETVSSHLNDEVNTYCTATLEDNFTDDCVLVVITNKASLDNLNYTTADFPEINCSNLRNLSQAKTSKVALKLAGDSVATVYSSIFENVLPSDFYDVDLGTFNQILSLKLVETGKDKVLEAIKILEQRSDVLYARPNYIYSDEVDISTTEYDIPTYLSTNLTRSITTNDTYASNQWAIDQISLTSAWGITTGVSAKVTVGIIDNGIDASHPDLTGKVNINKSREIDYHGNVSGVSGVTDSIGHGTIIAGIIGAQANNGIGISGVNWNVELVSLCLPDAGSSETVSAALNEAEYQGIPIVNYSGGIVGAQDVLRTSINNYSGLVICAGGNMTNEDVIAGDRMIPHYPAYYNLNNIITVGASTQFDMRWNNSYYGSIVNLFAPGAPVFSTISRSACTSTSCNVDGNYLPYSHHLAYGYHAVSGTSFAAPFVAGVASLILSKYPNLSTCALRKRILDAVDISSAYMGKCTSNGRLNAYKALHDHTYASSHIYSDETYHISYCSCGVYTLAYHEWVYMGDYNVCSGCEERQY